MKRFSSAQTIRAIVNAFPKAVEVFKAENIDFCCGGSRRLDEAIGALGLDEKMILQRLNTAYAAYQESADGEGDWTKRSLTELIDHIVNTHHAYL